MTTDTQLRKDLLTKISDQEQIVIRYDVPGRPSFLTQNLNLLEYIHKSVEYGSADKRRRKKAIKGTRQFAQAFSDSSIIISQDNKAKIGLGVPAVGRTFRTLQSALEPVQVPDHDFVCGINQKLIPSVYFMIKPSKINDDLRTGQMAIFVRSQWLIAIIHAEDISSLVSDDQYSGILKINNNIKPIWILLVDAGIVLPINHFGNHLDRQGKIIDTELATQNFRYASTMLCDIWCYDPIFRKHVNATYIDEATDLFINLEFAYEEQEKDEIKKKKRKRKRNQHTC
ncbi:hypothetical protein C2G38_2211032 [Gigaspora rosea]|uniref:Uncharacterized protein n=1 Tax=Gigaspora rosea TaxID=44941 RepID=A0A397UEU0_9GLOM|nr:hypothetical protein C2G38_2211032 [Gigaspora rosea]